MRDVAVTLIIFGSLPFILWRPQIGVMMWVWLSVMNPHRLTWGFAYDFNFAAIIAITTLTSALMSKEVKRPPLNLMTVALFSFAAWISVTTAFALHPEEAFFTYKTVMKTLLMSMLIPILFHTKEDVRKLLWVVVLSIAYYGAKGGAFTLLTGGANRVYGPEGSYVADNNAIAVAIVVIVPLLRYLQITTPQRPLRWLLGGTILLCCIAVLGTYSRGALLAVVAMLAFLWLKGRHKLWFLMIGMFAIPLALSVMPEQWYGRMETIGTYEQEDSANMRLNSWGTMWNLAKARPLTGGGFEVATPEVYAAYSPDQSFPPQVAHSIYFQALGEHGFVGLTLYLLLLFSWWASAAGIIKLAKERADLAWAADLSLMMQVSLIGFAVGGAFLSLVNFDVPYYLISIMAATLSLVKQQAATQAPASARAERPSTELAINSNSPRS